MNSFSAMSFDGEIFEIFSWLPAKTIYRFNSVCKWCTKLMSETFFLAKQAHNMMLKNDSSFFIQSDSSQSYNNEKIMEQYPLPGEDSSSSVPHNFLQFLRKTARILASSNGLVLCRNTMKKNQIELFICNPATQTWLSIPTPESSRVLTGVDVKVVFECNSSILNKEEFPHDYMLIIFEGSKDWSSYFECKIFSPKEGIWKERGEFNIGDRNIRFEMPVYYDGALHFISDCFPYITKGSPYYRPYIIAYDIEKGRSSLLRLPKEARRGSDDHSCDMGIFKWGVSFNSVCLIRLRKFVFTAWVLEDNCSSLWIRILKIRVGAMGLKEPTSCITGFTVMNGNSLVFATKEKVYRYGLMGERYRKIEEVCHHECGSNYMYFIPYSNTLRPCGVHAKPLII